MFWRLHGRGDRYLSGQTVQRQETRTIMDVGPAIPLPPEAAREEGGMVEAN